MVWRTFVELFLEIGRANDVKCDIARDSSRVFAYGFDTDIDAVQALYSSLVVQMVRASDEYIKSKRYAQEKVWRWVRVGADGRRPSRGTHEWQERPVHATTARVNFQHAFAARIGSRLAQAALQAREQAVDAERRARAYPHGAAPSGVGSSGVGSFGVGTLGVGSLDEVSSDAGAPGTAGAGGQSGMALVLRAKEVELSDHYRATSTARGSWRGTSATAGYSELASRAGDRAGRQARLGGERTIGGSRPALGR